MQNWDSDVLGEISSTHLLEQSILIAQPIAMRRHSQRSHGVDKSSWMDIFFSMSNIEMGKMYYLEEEYDQIIDWDRAMMILCELGTAS